VIDLTEDEQRELRHALLVAAEELAHLLSVTRESARPVDLDEPIGRLSRMDAMQAQAMSIETGRRRRKHILEVDAALKRIEAGDYGECLECGELINPKRLEANLRATLCINCAEARE
jgi:DnaK suppressor protein